MKVRNSEDAPFQLRNYLTVVGTFGANAGLPDVALGLLKPITEKYADAGFISNADLWALAANVAIKVMGGPDIPTRFGRVDATDSSASVESQVFFLQRFHFPA